MGRIVLQILVLFSVLCAGLHTPVEAHDEQRGLGVEFVQVAGAHHIDDHEQSPQDGATDKLQPIAHHIHCPMTVVGDARDATGLAFFNRKILWPGEATVLLSLTPDQPTEPPLA